MASLVRLRYRLSRKAKSNLLASLRVRTVEKRDVRRCEPAGTVLIGDRAIRTVEEAKRDRSKERVPIRYGRRPLITKIPCESDDRTFLSIKRISRNDIGCNRVLIAPKRNIRRQSFPVKEIAAEKRLLRTLIAFLRPGDDGRSIFRRRALCDRAPAVWKLELHDFVDASRYDS